MLRNAGIVPIKARRCGEGTASRRVDRSFIITFGNLIYRCNVTSVLAGDSASVFLRESNT